LAPFNVPSVTQAALVERLMVAKPSAAWTDPGSEAAPAAARPAPLFSSAVNTRQVASRRAVIGGVFISFNFAIPIL